MHKTISLVAKDTGCLHVHMFSNDFWWSNEQGTEPIHREILVQKAHGKLFKWDSTFNYLMVGNVCWNWEYAFLRVVCYTNVDSLLYPRGDYITSWLKMQILFCVNLEVEKKNISFLFGKWWEYVQRTCDHLLIWRKGDT